MRYDRLTYDRRGGFTLIEVMVAVGIILLLIGILIVGISFVGRSAKEKATRVTLKNVQAMFGELDAKTRLRNQPTQWSWRGEDIVPTAAHAPLALNFFTAPYRNDFNTNGFTGNGNGTLSADDGPDALDGPGLFDADAAAALQPAMTARHASRAVLNTQLVLVQFRAIPPIRSQLEQLPKEQQMTLQWRGGTRPDPGPDAVLFTGDDVAAGEDVHYFEGNFVENGGVMYRCKRAHQAQSAPTSGADWEEEVDIKGATRSVPVLLDAWQNPIIFVPSGGLAVRLNSDKDDNTAGENAIIKSPDNRPFWASAGADGNFRNGDDNVYSFED